MRNRVHSTQRRVLGRIAVASLLASVLAACSSTTQRFAGDPFGNPFGPDPASTGSISAAPSGTVQSQPLSAPPPGRVGSAPLTNDPRPSLQPLAPARRVTGPPQTPSRRVAPAQAPVSAGAGGWTAEGGSPITVNPGDNLQNLATRFGVPPTALLAANGLTSASQITPGSRLVVPVFNSGGQPVAQTAPARVAQAIGPAPVPPASVGQPAAQLPAGGQARFRLVPGAQPAAQGRVVTPKEAAPNPLATRPLATKPVVAKPVPVKEAAKPAASVAAKPEPKAAEPARPASGQAAKQQETPPPATTPEKSVARAEPVKPDKIASVPAAEPQDTASLSSQQKAPGAPEFRWPVRGRIIAGFGAKGGNEGINIAVPEGTPVKAVESGVVAYAGSELKNYGNLVLIRHDDGWVSAYAHNSEITVKRGDKVKRGQTVAKSGQSGNVQAPQVHFELRKGSTPVDPLPYLAGV